MKIVGISSNRQVIAIHKMKIQDYKLVNITNISLLISSIDIFYHSLDNSKSKSHNQHQDSGDSSFRTRYQFRNNKDSAQAKASLIERLILGHKSRLFNQSEEDDGSNPVLQPQQVSPAQETQQKPNKSVYGIDHTHDAVEHQKRVVCGDNEY